MSYLESGFNENLIRAGEEVQQFDNANIGELLVAGSIPITEVTNAMASAEMIDADQNFIKDVINARFDTQEKTIKGEFEFGASGALQIGAYSAGVSGDIKISPSGILARNSANVTTFAIDGETGSPTFLGTIVAGSVISATIAATNIIAGTFGAAMNVGNANVKIDGANKRIIINDGTNDRILIGYLAGKF